MNIGELIDHYQEWVDYDMKRYGKISDETNRDIEEAGLQIVKDRYGDYEVIAGKYNESLEGENGWIKRWNSLDKYYKGDLVISKISSPYEAWHIEKVAPNGRTIKHLGNYKSLEVAMDAAEQYLKKYTNNFSESLKEDTQLKFYDDMINDIDVLYGWRPQEVERILIKHGSDKNNDNWIDGLDLPAAYDEIMSTFRDKYSDDDEIDYDAAKVLGLNEPLKESVSLNKLKNIINVLNKNLGVRFKHSAGGVFFYDKTPFNTDIFNKLIENNYKSIGDTLEEQGFKYDVSEDAYISKDENLYVTVYGDLGGMIVQFEEIESESLKESLNSDIVSMIKKQFPKATVKTSIRKHSDVHKSNPNTARGKTKYVDIRITPDETSSINSILQYCNHNIKKVLDRDNRFYYYGDVPARNPRGSKEVILSYEDYSDLSNDEYKSLISEPLKESLRMSRDDFNRMCKENGILQGLSRRDYMEIRDLFHAGSESFDSAVNDLWHGDDDFHSRDWYENLLKKYIDQESLKEAKKLRAPKFWNTNFSDNVIKDYKAGKLTFNNIEEWDIAYNDGRKPNPPFNTKEILDYYLATKDTPTESAIKESVTFSDYMLDKNSVLHLTSDLLKDYNTTTSTTFICPKDEYFLVELSVDDGQHLLQCPHCQTQYGYDEDDIEATFDIL